MAQDFVVVTTYFGSSFRPVSGVVTDPAAGTFSWLDLDSAVWSLTQSPYFVKLSQYGVGRIMQNKSDAEPHDLPAAWSYPAQGFTDDELQRFVESEVDAARLPRPDSWRSARPLYLIVLPQGLRSVDHPDTDGFHWPVPVDGTHALCAWVIQGQSLHDTTAVVSHEIVGSVASEVGAGELSDDCGGVTGLVHGVMVEAYASREDRDACVIPGELRIDLRWDEARQRAELDADQSAQRADGGSRTST